VEEFTDCIYKIYYEKKVDQLQKEILPYRQDAVYKTLSEFEKKEIHYLLLHMTMTTTKAYHLLKTTTIIQIYAITQQ